MINVTMLLMQFTLFTISKGLIQRKDKTKWWWIKLWQVGRELLNSPQNPPPLGNVGILCTVYVWIMQVIHQFHV